MKTRWIGAAIVALGLLGSLPAAAQVQTVAVTGGSVEGVVSNGIVSFKGIPFAAPPIGDLRWKAPQPVNPWTGVKKADKFAVKCMQDPNMSAIFGGPPAVGEDCLYLNVWTPAKTAGDKLPVMVWIYGGGFFGGETSSPAYDGTRLAEKGVVLVSVAYRVGVFGFLAHPELSQESRTGSGNYGLRDQIAGLKWVKENIARFGGDPSRVTIFGESAGGISVSMLAASPAAKGLFTRAISESGGSFAPPRFGQEGGQSVAPLKVAEAAGQAVLTRIGASDIKAARALPADQIQKSTRIRAARFRLPGQSSMARSSLAISTSCTRPVASTTPPCSSARTPMKGRCSPAARWPRRGSSRRSDQATANAQTPSSPRIRMPRPQRRPAR